MAFPTTSHTSGVQALADLLNASTGKGYTPNSGIGPTDLAISILANLLQDQGAGVFSGQATFSDGTVAAPGISNIGDVDTGVFFSAANTVDVAAGGVRSAQFATATTGVNYVTFTPAAAGSPVLISGAGSDTDVGIRLVAKGAGINTVLLGGLQSLGVLVTDKIGYGTGAGGTVTQITNRSTGVTLSKLTGTIQTDTTSLAAEVAAVFTVTNTLVAIGDVVVVSIQSGTNGGNTAVTVTTVAAGSFAIKVSNNNAAGGTAETGAIIINFAVIKAVAA